MVHASQRDTDLKRIQNMTYSVWPQTMGASVPPMSPPGGSALGAQALASSNSSRAAQYRKNLSCSLCGRMFSFPAELERHFRAHTGERPFKCNVCGRGFTQTGNRNAHMKTCSQKAGVSSTGLPVSGTSGFGLGLPVVMPRLESIAQHTVVVSEHGHINEPTSSSTSETSPTLGTASAPERSPTLGTPSAPERSPTLGTPSAPERSLTLGTASAPERSPTLGTPSAPERSLTLGTPSELERSPTLGTPSATERSPTLGTPSVPERSPTLGTPSKSVKPPTLTTSSTPERSLTLETSSTRECSQTFGTPSVPESSLTLGTLSTLECPVALELAPSSASPESYLSRIPSSSEFSTPEITIGFEHISAAESTLNCVNCSTPEGCVSNVDSSAVSQIFDNTYANVSNDSNK